MDKIKSFLKFEDFHISKLNFIVNDNYIEDNKNIEISPKFSVRHKFSDNNKSILVTLSCTIFNNGNGIFDKNDPFYLEAVIKGDFQTSEDTNVDEDVFHSVLKVNTVSILFPYLRAAVTNLTAHTNVTPIVLPPINVNKLLMNQ
ncbi:Protein-export protein SecB [Bacillus velezensis]|uniref:protein-export chaperone SecB n=1 Tax=Bacillus amyloliquefaciens group TaxID=1938374 RepID=UPI0008DBB73D|nr:MULTISPECIES: protein-export chaperone SecB [Bacillus amyloliquefaciens group]APA02815.1 hypothetical protein BK055_09805 [Bacillus velezensis]MEC0403241.1 protein-export chaperone SecB [Bacillus velezensis]QHK65751.1 Protein-export protein SecB [Bacillus velezensis]QHL98515.1 Protein-export protein SecB [Bacillus velezensis]WJN56459.1 protein-export chaperone SecB [Bacillus velezensis]